MQHSGTHSSLFNSVVVSKLAGLTMRPLFLLTILSFVIQVPATVKLSPDTLAVKFNTQYSYGMEIYMKTRDAAHKYAQSFPRTLKNFVDFEFEFYEEISQLFDNYKASSKTNETDDFFISTQEYLKEFQDNWPNTNISKATNSAINILTPFLTIRRFRKYTKQWMLPTKPSAFKDSILKNFKWTYKISDGPHRTDFHYSMVVIIMAHFILDLRATDIAKGILRGKDVGVKLKASHSLDIGIHAVAMSMYPIGIQWLELAVDMLVHGDDTAELHFAKNWLQAAISKHDENWKQTDDLGQNLLETFYSKRIKETGPSEERKWHKQVACADNESLHNVREPAKNMPWLLQFSVCKGDIQQTELEKSRLFCWYERQVHPRWKIGPIKSEMLSGFPRGEIVRFLDVVGDNFARNLKGELNLEHVELAAPIPLAFSVNGRVLEDSKLAKKLQVLFESLTGLKAPYQRGFEVATNVPGGFYNTHEDWAGLDHPKGHLHNLASALIYLEEPEQDGQTAFVRLHLAVKPVKGSVVFNYDLLNSGKVDEMMPHAGCPLISGKKLTRDFWYWNQDHLTCYKEKNRRHEILVNGLSKYKSPRDTIEKHYRYAY